MYTHILDTVDGLGAFISSSPPVAALRVVIAQINKNTQAARGEDTGRLRDDVLPFIGQGQPLDPAVTHDKADRGFYHPTLAHFLCPAQSIHTYNQDPLEGCKMLRDGRIKTDACCYPLGFYRDMKYDQDNPEHGLFQSCALLQTGKYLFIGKSTTDKNAVLQGPKGIVKKFRITRVNGYMIAYTACQLRFAASSAETWATVEATNKGKKDLKGYSYKELYMSIVSLIEDDPEDEFSRRIIATWNYMSTPMVPADTIQLEEPTPEYPPMEPSVPSTDPSISPMPAAVVSAPSIEHCNHPRIAVTVAPELLAQRNSPSTSASMRAKTPETSALDMLPSVNGSPLMNPPSPCETPPPIAGSKRPSEDIKESESLSPLEKKKKKGAKAG
ncbi:hypothetical protein OF83DRAFT_1178501 [Amylostereum chailletii]|nr:hypothetical protein OF83DRAFT_1178501 [Amylostereum chailletii]